jgi:hypothetical protein
MRTISPCPIFFENFFDIDTLHVMINDQNGSYERTDFGSSGYCQESHFRNTPG